MLTEPIASKNMSVLELIALGRQPYTNWIGTLSKEDKTKIKKPLPCSNWKRCNTENVLNSAMGNCSE